MNAQEKQNWNFPTAEGLARGIGARALREKADDDGLVAGAIRAFTDSIKKRIGPVSGSPFAIEVAKSGGDLSKVPGSKELAEAIAQLTAIEGSGALQGTLGKPMVTIREAHALLTKNRAVFQKAFKGQAGTGKYVYVGAVIALYASVSLVIAECVEYVKGADGSFDVRVIEPAVDNVAGSIPLTRLERFMSRASKANFDGMLNERAAEIEGEAISESGLVAGVLAGAAVIAFLLWMARDIVAWFFGVRKHFASWLELQSRFLEFNALRMSGIRTQAARGKQEEYAAALKKMSDFVKVDAAAASKDAEREIKGEDQDIAKLDGEAPGTSSSLL